MSCHCQPDQAGKAFAHEPFNHKIREPAKPSCISHRRVVDKVVAQVSKPAVSQSFQPADAATLGTRLNFQRRADLEVGDTAGLETCATSPQLALALDHAIPLSCVDAAPFPPNEPNPGLERTRHQLRASGAKDEAANPLRSGIHTRGYLPHVKREGASYFVTFRLADSLPKEVLLGV